MHWVDGSYEGHKIDNDFIKVKKSLYTINKDKNDKKV
jgi:hypothetical protein